MPLRRFGLILLSVYLVFIVGGFAQNFSVLRWFNHAFMTLLAGGWLAWRIYKGRNLPDTRTNLIVFALLAAGFISVPFSESPRMALEYMWLPVMYTVIYLFIVNAFHRAEHHFILELVYFVTAVVVFLSFLQIGSAFFGWGLVRSAGQGWIDFIGQGIPLSLQPDMRIFLPLGVSTQVAGFVAPLIVLTLSRILWSKQRRRALWIILFVLLLIILVLTFSRGGFISLAAGLLTLLLLYLTGNPRIQSFMTPRNIGVGVLLLIVLAIVANSVVSLASIGSRITGDRARFDLWNSAIEMIADHPLTGVGAGQYGRELRDYRDTLVGDDRLATAHNIYLNTAAENGIVIFVIFVAAIGFIGWRWLQIRHNTSPDIERWHLLNGMLAALVGFAVHNLFDTLNVTGSILLVTVMVVYLTVKPAQSRLATIKQYGNRSIAAGLLLIVVGYGVWFAVIVDRAHWHHVQSVASVDDDIQQAQIAAQLDPAVDLYTLQVTYLEGWEAYNNPTSEILSEAITAYEGALLLEPTWTTGWWNLAALHELTDDIDAAFDSATRARELSTRQSGDGQWAYFAEMTGDIPDKDVIDAYYAGFLQLPYLPLSSYWTATDLRQLALRQYLEQLPDDKQYRVVRVQFPDYLPDYIPDDPQTAAEWWITGEQALSNNEVVLAIDSFSRAIDLAPGNGDYYASRARALIAADDSDAALEDLNRARFTGTRDEYPNAIESSIVEDQEQRIDLIKNAIPPYSLPQNFEGVVYNGRRAQFVPYDSVRRIGRGDAVLQLWYDLAQYYITESDTESAIEIYQLLRLHAPENNDIRIILAQLE